MNILVFGASIVSGKADLNGGWVQYLSSYLQKDTINLKGEKSIDVYNLAINGDTSEGLLSRISEDIKPRLSQYGTIVLVSIGLNDSQFNMGDNRTPLDRYKAILEGIVAKAQGLKCKVIFVGLTPIDESKTDPIPWREVKDTSYLVSEVNKYNSAMREVAMESKINFINLLDRLGQEYLDTLSDGVHPDSIGHRMIFELLKDDVKHD